MATEADLATLAERRRSGQPQQSYPLHRSLFVEPKGLLPLCCASCAWWKPLDAADISTSGECRKRAPLVPPSEPFPITEPRDNCGEFTRYYSTEEWLAVKAKLVPTDIPNPPLD